MPSDGERSRRHTSPPDRNRPRAHSPSAHHDRHRYREDSVRERSRDDHKHQHDRPSSRSAQDRGGARHHSGESRGDAGRTDERYRFDRRSRDDYKEALYGGFDQGFDEPQCHRFRDSSWEREREGGFRHPHRFPSRERRKSRSRTRSRSPQDRRHRGSAATVHRPSPFLRVLHLPADTDEGELTALFAPVPGVVRLSLDPLMEANTSSSNERTALLEMAAVEPAMALINSEWREGAFYRQCRFRLEYTPPPSPPRGILEDTDWLCSACGSLNFSRRSKCYNCRGLRTADVQVVDPYAPSHVLRISNLEDHMEENALEELIKPLAPVKTLRLSRDKVTGGSRGTAFVYFYSVDEATAVREKLDGCQIEGQRWKLRITYARDRMDPSRNRSTTGPGQTAGENVSGWEPKAFDEAAITVETNADVNAQQALSVVNPVLDNTAARAFEKDAETGYLKDPATGYLYDDGTGYYFNPKQQQWGTLDAQTGAFTAYTHAHDTEADGAEPLPTTQSLARHEDAVAVIGAEAQLDPQALLEVARAKVEPAAEEERERKGLSRDPEPSDTKVGVQGIVHRGKWAQRMAAREAEKNLGM